MDENATKSICEAELGKMMRRSFYKQFVEPMCMTQEEKVGAFIAYLKLIGFDSDKIDRLVNYQELLQLIREWFEPETLSNTQNSRDYL